MKLAFERRKLDAWVLRELLRPQLHECRNNLVLIPHPCALQAFHKHLLVRQVVGVSHHADSNSLAGFVLER